MQLALVLIGMITTVSLIDGEIFGIDPSADPLNLRLWLVLALFALNGIHGILARKKILKLTWDQNDQAVIEEERQQSKALLAERNHRVSQLEDKNRLLQTSLNQQESQNHSQQTQFAKEQTAWQEQVAVAKAQYEKMAQDIKTWQQGFHDQAEQLQRLETALAAAKDRQNQSSDAASLLSLLQEKGRFVDYLMEDASQVSDEQWAAASRIVHQGCQGVLREYFDIQPVVDRDEGTAIDLAADYRPEMFRIKGVVADQGPYSGTVIHKGWRVDRILLPQAVHPQGGQHILSPAEVEVGQSPYS